MCSSAFSRQPSSYDVFINFRGVDTRDNFVYLLNEDLQRAGIHVFIDSEELWEGEEICPSLLRAIRGSKISIPVFSKRYAESKYCLLELAQMWECHLSDGQTILPIFIGVEPHHVRYQKESCFQKPLEKHKRRGEPVEVWKSALTNVADLKGWSLEVKGDASIKEQSNMVKLVVQRALRELDSTSMDEHKHLIGMDSHVDNLLGLLYTGSDDVQFVGICGMGGLGKTTIAEAVHNRIFKSFKGSSFLGDVREKASKGNIGLVSLQRQLLGDVLKTDHDISNVSKGSKLIAERLHRKNILLILDDVDDHEQLDALAGGLNWFGQGSKIIITTRDEHVLNLHKNKIGKDIQKYMPEVMNFMNSLLLFSMYAFSKNKSPGRYKLQLSYEVVSCTGGLPLSLEVLGSFLNDKDKKEWEDTLEILKNIGNDNFFGKSIKDYDDKVFKKLMISYNQLGCCEKTIFLDVACYFNGWNKEIVISIWQACELYPRLAIKVLIQKHLLKIDANGNLKMHDQLQAMGRKIIMEESHGDPSKRSRLWSQNEIWKVLKKDTGTQMVEGLVIQNFEFEAEDEFEDEFEVEDEFEDEFEVEDEFEAENVLSIEAFQKMPNLRFLDFHGISSLIGEFAHLPSKLRSFYWHGMKIIPPDFYHPELVYLELSCESLQQSWNDPTQNKKERFHKLKFLSLCYYMEVSVSPDFFLWFPCLQSLNLYRCADLLELPEGICRLASLKTITIDSCWSFKKLPTSIGDLKHLVELCLCDTKIRKLPDGVGQLEKLEKLIVIRRGKESFYHADFELLVNGDFIQKDERILRRLYGIAQIASDGHGDLKCYPQLLKLPASIGRMNSLHHINLGGYQIKKLPDDFSKLFRLEVFKIGIGSWSQMDVGCSFKYLPEFPSTLTHLQVEDCTSLLRIPVQSRLERLKMLSLRNCKLLVELPNLSNLKRLRYLNISGCQNIQEIPSLEGTEFLEVLIGSNCEELTELPDLSKLKRLRVLKISRCLNVEKIHGLEEMESLEELDTSFCSRLKELPDLSKLKRLKKLNVEYCKNLEEIHNLTGSFKELDLSNLRRLRKLNIGCDENLEKIHNLKGTESLEELYASSCYKLRDFTDLSKVKRLRKLNLRCCENLEEIHGLDGRKFLIELDVRGCYKLTETRRKILGQGTLVHHVGGQVQGINGSPILCVVFSFTRLGLAQLQAGKLGIISFETNAVIRREEIRTRCLHSIRIEDIEFTNQDIIYIHHFKGFDWFGFPLESKDAIDELNVRIHKISDPCFESGSFPSICGVKFVKVLFENKESNRPMPNQQSSAKLVAEFFRWSDADDAEKVEEKVALGASNCKGACFEENEDQQRLDQPSHVQEKEKTSSSQGIELEKEETSSK